jgi:hypothetical protein
VTLQGSGSSGPGFTFQWLPSNGGSVLSGGSTLTPVVNHSGDYKLVVTSTASGCTASSQTQVSSQFNAPAVTATGGSLNCYASSVALSAAYNPLNISFVWQGPNNYTSSQPNPVVSTAGAYYFVATDTLNGCITKAPAPVVANFTAPDVSVGGGGTITCLQPSVQLTGASMTQNVTWLWTGPNGFTSTQQNPVVTTPGPYKLTATNPLNGCTSSAAITVTANLLLPTVTATAGGVLNCNNTTITLLSTSSLPVASYAWSGPNNFTSSVSNPSVGVPGLYKLTVTASTNGCTGQASVNVFQNITPPNVSATGGIITCAVPAVTLQGNSTTSGATYLWTGPNNFTSTLKNPVVNALGIYVLQVTNPQNGCTASQNVTVTQNINPPNLSASTAGTITCTTPQIKLLATSTTPGAAFAWTGPNNFASALQNPFVSVEGYYSVTVTNPANGCTNTSTVYMYANNTVPFAYAGEDRSLNCYFTSILINGSFSSTGTSYTYLWTTLDGHIVTGVNTLTPLADAPGNYLLKVTNTQNGCTSKDSMYISQSDPVTAAINQTTPVYCSGSSTGSAKVTGAGGTVNFTYKWSNGAQTQLASGLSAGTYTVTVTDSDGCTATASAIVTQLVLTATISATAQTTPGVNNGTASVSPGGGTAPYTVKWSNNQTTPNIANLAPGAYSVTITDAHGCTLVKTTNVNAANCNVTGALVTSNVTCNGASNGSASVNLTGALNPITYSWTNGAGTQTASNLAPGVYTVTATDAAGCHTIQTAQISGPPALVVSFSDQQPLSCPNSQDGLLTAGATGGTQPYVYQWSNGSTVSTISGIPAGSYTVTVTDAKSCSTTLTAGIVNPDPIVVSVATQSNITCTNGHDGSVTIQATGGTQPLSYHWPDGSTGTSLSGLQAGAYILTVTDAKNCSGTLTVNIQNPQPIAISVMAKSDVLCPSGHEGMITASSAGGTQPHNFIWSTGSTTPTISSLSPGAYNLTVTDANGCTKSLTQQVLVTDHNPPVLLLKNAMASLDNSGAVSVTPAMFDNGSHDAECGIASWTVVPTHFDCTQTGVQIVMLTATDQNGNSGTGTATVTIQDNVPPTIQCPADLTVGACNAVVYFNTPVVSDNCNVNPAKLTQTGGIASGATFPSGTTLESFSYSDAGGNAAQCSFHVTVGAVLSATVSSSPATCAAACDGNISVDISSAAAPYTINWNNGQTGASLANLCPGSYTVTISDVFGCSQTWSTNLSLSDNVPPVISCPGNITTGACQNTVNYAMPVVTDNCPVDQSQIQMLSGLAPGSVFPAGATTQTYSFTDGYGNNTQCSFTVSVQGAPSINLATTDVLCSGHCDGTATMTLNGGFGPFNVTWSNGQSDVKANSLCSGTYLATVTDAAGCTLTAAAFINQPQPLDIVVSQTVDDIGGAGTGSIQITVSGGLSPYHYLWTRNGQIFGNTKDLSHLTQGQYVVQVTDANNCALSSDSIVISNLVATTAPEWTNGFRIQPNPATDFVRIVFEHALAQPCAVRLCNGTGETVREIRMNAAEEQMDLEIGDLPVGIWVLQVYAQDGKSAIKKLIIAR